MEGKSPMRRTLAVVLAAALLLVVGAVAYASIPGPDGVIHGCYKTSNPAQGALITIDSAASCPSGYTALNWNQTGPQGPSGITETQVVGQAFTGTGANGFFSASLSCPSGTFATGGGGETQANDPNDFVIQDSQPLFTSGNPPTGWRVQWRYVPGG